MPELITQLQGDLDTLLEDIGDDADLLLKSIDLKRALEDPEYIRNITAEWIEQQMDRVRAGIARGEKFAKTVLKQRTVFEASRRAGNTVPLEE